MSWETFALRALPEFRVTAEAQQRGDVESLVFVGRAVVDSSAYRRWRAAPNAVYKFLTSPSMVTLCYLGHAQPRDI